MFGAISGLNSLHDVKIFNTTSGLLSFRKIRPCWWSSRFTEGRRVHIFCLRLCSSFEPLAFGSGFTAWDPDPSLMSPCYRLTSECRPYGKMNSFSAGHTYTGNSSCMFVKRCSHWGICVNQTSRFWVFFKYFNYICLQKTMDSKAIFSDYWKH